ncbi:MAG: 3-oxoacyl-[acyl-carrier-protein] synthase III C-terminal domain-containing protein [Reyranellaceae bacterium]
MVFITALGSHLPGPPVENDAMEAYLGPLDQRQRRLKAAALKRNGIRRRHYALGTDGRAETTSAAMAAEAARAALAAAEIDPQRIGFLAAASSQNDLLAPGIASSVHGELRTRPLDIASFNSFCASGMMAMEAAWTRLLSGRDEAALVCASEFASRFLRAGYIGDAPTTPDSEFLRWTLSDGAGAAVLESRPNEHGLSLRIDWIDLKSYADTHDTCMWGGASRDRALPWSNYPTLEEARRAGAFLLQQDLESLDAIVPLGVRRYFELIEDGRLDPHAVDFALYHFSTDHFRKRLIEASRAAGAPFDPAKLFTNLYERGNTGSASIFVMLDELFKSGRLKPGQRILCMVPESGRFIISFMHLTVVGEVEAFEVPSPRAGGEKVPSASEADEGLPLAATTAVDIETPPSPSSALRAPSPRLRGEKERLLRRLTSVWGEFESGLNRVPVIERMKRGRLRLEDYRLLLGNLRQQVIEGARWIARAASSIEPERLDLRSTFLRHAQEEHRDFLMLERDYVAAGGALDDIRSAPKNIGSEALSAWMFHRASQPNPIDLLGAMFIIEGLGSRLAARWGEAIRRQLKLPEQAVSFLAYHGGNDEGHLEKLWRTLGDNAFTQAIEDSIVKTAKVTARLYRLQLEELGNA